MIGKSKYKIQGDDGIFRPEEMQMRGSSVRGERDSGGDRDNVPRRQPTMHLRDSCTVPSILETRTLYQSDKHFRL